MKLDSLFNYLLLSVILEISIISERFRLCIIGIKNSRITIMSVKVELNSVPISHISCDVTFWLILHYNVEQTEMQFTSSNNFIKSALTEFDILNPGHGRSADQLKLKIQPMSWQTSVCVMTDFRPLQTNA